MYQLKGIELTAPRLLSFQLHVGSQCRISNVCILYF